MNETVIRLLVSDVDGTLVRHDKSLSDANRDAVRALIADGVPATLISARPPSGMIWLAEALGISGPLGAFNGGTLFNADGTILFAHRIEAADAAIMIEMFKAAKVSIWAFADGKWYTDDLDHSRVARERLASNLEPILRTDFHDLCGRIDKIVGVSDDRPLLQSLEKKGQAAIGARATIVQSQVYYLDITHRLANKGDGIAALAKAMKVDLANVAALGDMPNDLPMFARAGLSVAMGQAPEDVRNAADEVAAANDDDGVADAIKRFVRPQKAPPL
jgi:Cof subfamily protein (haloacid dehalogenase superfamily)